MRCGYFSVEKCTLFLHSLYKTPNLKMFSLHCMPQILHAYRLLLTVLIIRVKAYPQNLPVSHTTFVTDKQTDDNSYQTAKP